MTTTTTTTITITTCSHLSNKHQGLLFSRLSRRLLFFLVFLLCLLSSCSNQAQAQDQAQDQSQDQAQTQAQESTAGTTLIDFTCDLLNDKCPTQSNSICESSFAETPAQTSTDPACLNNNNGGGGGGGGDCLDCNALTCGQYDYDCLGCLTATVGCFWCPGDATCNNSPYYIFSVSTSCSPPSSLNASVEEGGYVASPKTADYCNASTFNKNNNDSDTTETIMFSDPLLPAQQWIFDQINVLPVWQEKNITGQGVRIRINDDGVDGSILELQNKLDVEASCELYAPIVSSLPLSTRRTRTLSSSRRTLPLSSSSSSLSSPVLEYNPNQNQITNGQFGHGTIVASIVGGHANNGQCGVGIAPDVMLSSCNVFAVASTTTTTTTTFVEFATKVDQFDISQNSIGVQACSLLKEAAENNNQGRRNRRGRRRQRRDLQVDGGGGTAGEGGGVEDDATNCPFEALDAEPCAVCNFTLPTSTSTTPTTTTTPACAQSIVSYCEKNFYRDEFACLDFLDLLIGPNRQCDYNRIPDIMLEAITDGIMQGRNGKGIIYVFASGNDNRIGDDVNFGGLTNSRLTVTVGAVGKDGLHASYSTTGAALLVTAPGGDSENISNHVAALQGGGCSANLQGTSFAAPVVSAVIALMLQANPDLSWRDVQGILAQTSKMPVPGADTNDDTRVTNEAGLVHSNKYGFGIINANDAVEAAQNWDFYCPEQFLQAESGLVNLIITDDSSTTPISSIITVDGNTTTTTSTTTAEDVNVDGFIVESVVVLLDVVHFSRGDLEVSLVSPSGTTSLLSPGPRPENTQHDEEERWKLMTVRNWGESVVGDWTLSIRDVRVGDLTTCVDAPFRAQYQGLEIDCQYLSTEGLCANGSPDATTIANNLLTLQVEGFTIEDACCDCGGGFSTTDFEDRLIQWRLVVYGRTEICEGKNSTMTTTTRGSDPPSSTPSESPTPKATTTATKEAPTKNQEEEEEPEAEKDPKERTATIVASVVAFVLSFAFIYAVLREPSSSSKNRCFGNRSGVNGDHATSNGESGPLFQPVEGGMKNIV